MKEASAQRVVHLTFHKCGSQWIRDVLTAPEIVSISGISHDPGGTRPKGLWPVHQPGTFLGPLYNRSYADWLRNRTPDTKTILVLRDPRDRLISWVFSFSYSHVTTPVVRVIRDPLLALDLRNKIMLGMFEFSRISRIFRDWAEAPAAEDLYVTNYEKIVASQFAEFQRMTRFLGWQIPDAVLESAVQRLSFETRSGRARGETDLYSHYRRGTPGDWRNYFDRELGEVFEARFPGLLATVGYEQDRHWFKGLPETIEANSSAETTNAARLLHELEAQLTRAREENEELRRELAREQAASAS